MSEDGSLGLFLLSDRDLAEPPAGWVALDLSLWTGLSVAVSAVGTLGLFLLSERDLVMSFDGMAALDLGMMEGIVRLVGEADGALDISFISF